MNLYITYFERMLPFSKETFHILSKTNSGVGRQTKFHNIMNVPGINNKEINSVIEKKIFSQNVQNQLENHVSQSHFA